jgi:hypothetical protein
MVGDMKSQQSMFFFFPIVIHPQYKDSQERLPQNLDHIMEPEIGEEHLSFPTP